MRPWPAYRTAFLCAGVVAVAAAVSGPLAERAHLDFRAHMATHLLLGMLGPLLLVLGAPITLALRTLPAAQGRQLVAVLASRPLRLVAHPVTAAGLDVGGLWVLYTTGLYERMHSDEVLHAVVHLHVLVAGYLFTAALVGVDPNRHRASYALRAAVLVLASAGHGMLAKHLYAAAPPPGVPVDRAEAGAMLMYYGGDLVTLVLTVVLCAQWYRAPRPRVTASRPGRSAAAGA